MIGNDLPEEESQLLNTHVGACEECREKLALMNAVQMWERSGNSRQATLASVAAIIKYGGRTKVIEY